MDCPFTYTICSQEIICDHNGTARFPVLTLIMMFVIFLPGLLIVSASVLIIYLNVHLSNALKGFLFFIQVRYMQM